MKKTIEVMVDDLDKKSPVKKSVTLTVDNKTYTLDLGEKNLARLHRVLEPFTKAANEVSVDFPKASKPVAKKAAAKKTAAKPRVRRARKATAKKGPSDHQVRTWANENGVPVGKAGRVGKAAREAFLAAHDAASQAKNAKTALKSAEKVLSDAA